MTIETATTPGVSPYLLLPQRTLEQAKNSVLQGLAESSLPNGVKRLLQGRRNVPAQRFDPKEAALLDGKLLIAAKNWKNGDDD